MSDKNKPCVQNASGIVLGFDFGTVRVGVSVGNKLTASARPLCIVAADARRQDKWERIAALVREWMPEVLVVGLPRHPDGTPHEVSRQALRFARQLAGRTGLPVAMVDERYSSRAVETGAADPVDDASAAVILQQWFDEGCPENPPQKICLE